MLMKVNVNSGFADILQKKWRNYKSIDLEGNKTINENRNWFFLMKLYDTAVDSVAETVRIFTQTQTPSTYSSAVHWTFICCC
jgi:hypothetical protein